MNMHNRNLDARNKWIISELENIPSGLRILDAGAGECPYKRYCSHLDYVSQDFGKYDGIGDGKGLYPKTWNNTKLDIVSDITNIPEPDQSFDVILCAEVLEHIPEPYKAIEEFSRITKQGGILLITAPFCSLTHFAPYHFSTGFNRYFYEDVCNRYGYKIEQIQYNGNYFAYLEQEIHRLDNVAIRYAPRGLAPGRFKFEIRKLAKKIILSWLNELEKYDSGSHELLSFGLHVKAIKQ